MRKFLQKSVLLLLAIFSFGLASLFAQVPQAINFQAIARDGDSNPMVNTNIQIRLSVVDETPEGTVVYQELRALQTNAYGSFSFQIGVGANFVTIGTMEEIEWENGSKFLKIDYDPTNTFTFNLTLGTIEFVSVPYAFAAETVVFIDATGAENGDVLVYNEVTGKFEPGTVTAGSVTWENVQNKPDFSNYDTDVSDDFSGDYEDLTNKPTLFDGQYSSLNGTPTIPADVADLSDNSNLLFDGDYNNLTNQPTLFNGSYSSLTDVPVNLDTDVTDDFSGDYDDLVNKPTLFDGQYSNLNGTPNIPADLDELTDNANLLFDGDYNSLTNTPDLSNYDNNVADDFSGSFNDLTDKPDFSEWDQDNSDDFDGQYASLTGVPTNVSSLTNDMGYISSENDADPNNEIQTLSVAGNNLSISNGNTILLPISQVALIQTVTRAELDLLSPQVGELAYNSTDEVVLMWNGINWIILSDDCFPQPTIANAGLDQTVNDTGYNIILSANSPIEGDGSWSILSGSGGTLDDINNPNSGFTGVADEEYYLKWTISTACKVSVDTVIISFVSPPSGWTVLTEGITSNQTNEMVSEGAKAMSVTFKSTTNQDIISDEFNVTAGANFSYTLDVYDFDSAGRVRMIIEWDTFTDYLDIYSQDIDAWQALTYAGIVPSGATTAHIKLRFYDDSPNWDGDATLVIDNASYSENGGSNLIPNGGFED
ncbi:MAG: hypothetical protein JXR36_15340 [Bacteroidales bacterium]|nr:hypothetical protein [Bacteroidales bacterium]